MYYDTKYSPTKNLKPLNFAKARTFATKITPICNLQGRRVRMTWNGESYEDRRKNATSQLKCHMGWLSHPNNGSPKETKGKLKERAMVSRSVIV